MELGFQIPIVSGIPDPLSYIPDFKAQDSGFYKQKLMLNIRINFLDSKSGFPYVERFLGYLLVLLLFVRSV